MEDMYDGLGSVDKGLNDTTKEYLLNDEAQNTGFIDATGKAFTSGDNIGYQLYQDVSRKVQAGEPDPAWDTSAKEAWISQNSQYLPDSQRWRYMQTTNKGEASALLNDSVMQSNAAAILARRGGVSTFAAQMLAGVVDIDTPLTIATGGLSAVAKLGYGTTKIGRAALGGVSGAAVGAALGAGSYAANPNGDYSEIVAGGLAGLAFGALTRGVVEWRANELADSVRNEFGETLADGMPLTRRSPEPGTQASADTWGYQERANAALEAEAAAEASRVASRGTSPASGDGRAAPEVMRDWQEVEPEDIAPDLGPNTGYEIQGEGASVGARQNAPRNGPGVASIASTQTSDIITKATSRLQSLGIENDYYGAFDKLKNMNPVVGRAAERFHQALNTFGLTSDFERLFRGNSAVAKVLAYDLLEQPIGAVVNNRSAANVQDVYFKRLQGQWVMDHDDAYSEWAVRTQNANKLDMMSPKLRDQFEQAVIWELEARKNDISGTPRNVDAAVKRSADAIDRAMANEIEILKGKPGESGWHGTDQLTVKSGYFPHRWSGRKINQLIKDKKATLNDIYTSVAVSVKSAIPGASMREATTWAKAIVDHARVASEGFNTNLISMLQGDGARALEDLLRRNGVPAREAQNLIDNLQFSKNERSRPGFTKQRIDVDLRDTHNNVRLLDLVDTDIHSILGARFRKSSGMGALARKDIVSHGQIDDLVRAVLEEQQARGLTPKQGILDLDADREITQDELRHIFGYFIGRPSEERIDPIVQRIRKATNLSLLNTLGLTQVAEFATIAASVGYRDFLHSAPKEIRAALSKKDSVLMQELKHFNIFVPEERLFRDDLTFATEAAQPDASFTSGLDNLLNKAQRVQGYTSLFYQVRNIQQRLAVSLGSDKVMKMLRDWNPDNLDRLALMGMDTPLISRFHKYIQNGTVEFENDFLKKLNLDKWSPEDAEDFTLVMNRLTNQQVQKAMAGESNQLFQRNSIAAMFVHLKSFTLLAMEKQFLKHARMADSEALALSLYGLMFAGSVYTARQLLSGNTEYLGPTDVIKGAVSYSNMAGWIPMMTDPVASMLGMDDARFYNFGSIPGRGGDVLSTPPFIETANKLARLPGAALDVVTGSSDIDTVRSFQALPIIGNAYGMTFMFNSIKDGIREEKARKKIKDDPLDEMRGIFDIPIQSTKAQGQ